MNFSARLPGTAGVSRLATRVSRTALTTIAVLSTACAGETGTQGSDTVASRDASRETPVATASAPAATNAAERIVTIGGGITETVSALGAGPQVVAIDLTSTGWPPELARLPQVGQLHALSSEGILSQRPTLVVANAEARPAEALEQVRAAGVRVETIPPARSEAQAYDLYRAVARALGRPAAGDSLADRVRAELARVTAAIPEGAKPRVLFLYARGPRLLLVFGRESAGDEMLRLAGAENAVSGITGAKPLTPEAVVGARPDVILVPSRGLQSIGGVDGVLALPGLAQTPAGRARRVVPIDDALILGFGPRLPEAVETLARAVRGDTAAVRRTASR
jgi:iron complex transport system substrate-binding protein